MSETSLIAFRRRIALEEKIMLDSFHSSFPEGASRVAVYSNSGMVKKALAILNRPLEVDVALCSPEGEGQKMAESLAQIPGLVPCLWTDGAYFSRILEVEAIVFGCDAISPEWFVNRSGTKGIVRLASIVGIPVFVVEGPLKRLSDDELNRMPLKRGMALPVTSVAAAVQWENPMLEAIETEGVTVVGMP